MRAAVLHEIGQDKLEVLDDVEATGFGPGKVRIRVRATGLCHSDLSAMSGVLPQPAPFIPGHEGAGEIVEVGDGVGNLKAGDRVVVCWLPACGACPACKRGQTELCLAGFMNAGTPNFRRPGGDLFGFAGTGTFTEEVVVDAGCAVPIPDDVPFDLAALMEGMAAAARDATSPQDYRARIGAMALANRLAAVSFTESLVRGGAVACYSPDFARIWPAAVDVAVRILHGENVGAIPVNRKLQLKNIVNAKSLKELGLTLPQSLLDEADEIIS